MLIVPALALLAAFDVDEVKKAYHKADSVEAKAEALEELDGLFDEEARACFALLDTALKEEALLVREQAIALLEDHADPDAIFGALKPLWKDLLAREKAIQAPLVERRNLQALIGQVDFLSAQAINELSQELDVVDDEIDTFESYRDRFFSALVDAPTDRGVALLAEYLERGLDVPTLRDLHRDLVDLGTQGAVKAAVEFLARLDDLTRDHEAAFDKLTSGGVADVPRGWTAGQDHWRSFQRAELEERIREHTSETQALKTAKIVAASALRRLSRELELDAPQDDSSTEWKRWYKRAKGQLARSVGER